MPYGLILLVVLFALTGKFVFVADVSRWLKAWFGGLLLVSFVWRYGVFLQLGLSLGLSLYFTYLKARALPETNQSQNQIGTLPKPGPAGWRLCIPANGELAKKGLAKGGFPDR